MEKLIIYGTGKLAQMVYYLLRESGKYEVVCFTADAEYCREETFLSLPLIDFDKIEESYPPGRYRMATVVGGLGGTEIRQTMFQKAKEKGYLHINFMHPTVVVEGEIELGENNIIFPYSILGFAGRMGDNNIIREKVYVGHDFHIGDHCFVGVGCNLGGECCLGNLAYIAMDVTLTNNIKIADRAFVGIGSLVLKDLEEKGGKYFGRPARRVEVK